MKSTITLSALLVSLAVVSSAQAALTMHVNTADKTFAISGSTTGTPTALETESITQWSAPVGPTIDVSTVDFDNDLTFSTDDGEPGSSIFNADTIIASLGGPDRITLNFRTTSQASQTFTGLENFQSYAGLGTTTR